MNAKKDELTRRYLILFKLDAEALYDRVVRRKREYLEIFALKRKRDHFDVVFYSKYWHSTFSDLVHCSEEAISTMDKFYRGIEELKWYLDHTDDMPNTIDDELDRRFKKIKETYEMLSLYLDADLGVEHDQSQKFEIAPLPVEDAPVDAIAGDVSFDFGEATFVSDDDLEIVSEDAKDNP
jgi:hypothetical protein